ncbi:MAG TPA: TssQ family T6SS-associated lipoprotein [Burkholderiaceae bacterium]
MTRQGIEHGKAEALRAFLTQYSVRFSTPFLLPIYATAHYAMASLRHFPRILLRLNPRLVQCLLMPLCAALLWSCAHEQETLPNGQPRLSVDTAQASYTQGLAEYHDGHYEIALGKLQVATDSDRLKPAQATDARKHMAFIYCITSREAECRAQFQAALKIAPDFDLTPGEIGHPLWGPVWRSIKGEHAEQLALAQAESAAGSPAQHQMAAGISAYHAGRFKEATENLAAALKEGLAQKSDEILTHKYAAFSYCLEMHYAQCHAEFHAIFALDASFELLPSEANHPVWAGIYRKEQAAAKHGVQK